MQHRTRINGFTVQVMQVQVTKAYAKSRICLFFTQEWPQTETELLQVSRITEGYCNMVHIVRRLDHASKEPAVLILRHYGGNHFDLRSITVKCSELEETLIVSEMSSKGWGPRLFGVFAGGRIEEFIDSVSLTPHHFLDAGVRHELARNYARFHSLQLPLQRNKIETFRHEVYSVSPETRTALTEHVARVAPDLLDSLTDFLQWDISKDKKWLLHVCQKEEFRRAFCIVDTNSLNVLMRKDRTRGKSFIVLVDYEMGCYGYAAQDLGGHMMMRTVDIRNEETMLSGLDYPSMDYISGFVRAYADECRELGTWEAGETVDHLIRQTLFGSLIWMVLFSEAMHSYPSMITKEKNILRSFAESRKVYKKLKDQLSE